MTTMREHLTEAHGCKLVSCQEFKRRGIPITEYVVQEDGVRRITWVRGGLDTEFTTGKAVAGSNGVHQSADAESAACSNIDGRANVLFHDTFAGTKPPADLLDALGRAFDAHWEL